MVYCGGANCTLAPLVLPDVQALVVAGVTVVSSTKQGAQLTSIRLVPSYSGYADANRPPMEGRLASVAIPSVVALLCAVPADPVGVDGWLISTKLAASISTTSTP